MAGEIGVKDREKLGGGTETVTTYSYSKQWSERLINSSNFAFLLTMKTPAR